MQNGNGRHNEPRRHALALVEGERTRAAAKEDIGLGFDRDGHFTDAYSAHPTEIRPLLEQNGLTFVAMIGSEGLRTVSESVVNQLTGQDWEAWVELNYQLAQDSTVHGAAIHLLAVARKA